MYSKLISLKMETLLHKHQCQAIFGGPWKNQDPAGIWTQDLLIILAVEPAMCVNSNVLFGFFFQQ